MRDERKPTSDAECKEPRAKATLEDLPAGTKEKAVKGGAGGMNGGGGGCVRQVVE